MQELLYMVGVYVNETNKEYPGDILQICGTVGLLGAVINMMKL